MAETPTPPPFAVQAPNGHVEFGPTQEDTANYIEILEKIKSGELPKLNFSPRVNAELASTQIDRGSLGIFVNSDVGENGLDDQSRLKFGQQRYIAGVLGLRIGENKINPNAHIASAEVTLPLVDRLPELPERTPKGKFVRNDGTEISQIQADAIYAAHFIANNREYFNFAGAFEGHFRRVVEQAEAGSLEVEDKLGDPKGAMSFVRQTAHVLGYKVKPFIRNTEGKYVAQVDGIEQGFEAEHTHFKH